MLNIHTIGGYNEVGKNMTAVEIDNEDVIVFDCGLYLPPIVELEEREKVYTEAKLRAMGALPDDLLLEKKGLKNKVRCFLIGHAHLDHVGAVPYVTNKYKASVLGTPFTTGVLKSILEDNHLRIKNPIKSVQPNSGITIEGKKKYKVEFVNITHSTLQTSMIALHTKQGIILYANDFKFDNTPILGKKPNYDKLKEIAKKGVKALIVDSLYSGLERKTPSEKVARSLLEDVMLTTDNKNSGIVITTFSSHIARLKSIVDFGKQLNRKVVLVGRSLNKYINAAKNANLCPFEKDIILASYRSHVERVLKKISKNRKNYLLVCTGHQGEPGSVLERLSRGDLPFSFQHNDHVIFSSKIIPAPINVSNRKQMEKKLKQKGVRIFDEVHVSGHASREDLRDMIKMIHPEHIIPAHGDLQKLSPMAELASEMGYKFGKNCHLMQDTQNLVLK